MHFTWPVSLRVAITVGLLSSVCSTGSAQNASAYVVVDSTTGYLLDGLNPTKKAQVGSLTKVATGMVVLDWADTQGAGGQQALNQLATVPDAAANVGGVNGVGLRPGDQVSLRDLLYAALMQSDNVAALTLADHVGRTLAGAGPENAPVAQFVAQMNALARKLAMQRTLFLNPHGLDSTEKRPPYSTAGDMARLGRYAMSRSAFRFYVSQNERTIAINGASGAPSKYTLRNTNELVGVSGIDGVKTGTTRLAGECVIISAERPPESIKQGSTFIVTPRRLVVVVLGSSSRFQVARDLLARGWEAYDQWAAAGRPMEPGSPR